MTRLRLLAAVRSNILDRKLHPFDDDPLLLVGTGDDVREFSTADYFVVPFDTVDEERRRDSI